MKLKKNDNVRIISGKDKGKTGKIIQVFPKLNKIVVEGLNIRIKHMRPKKQGEKGQKIEFSAPLDASKVAFNCPKCGRVSRIGYKFLENKDKVRICKKCNEMI
jgi:large subunit ribosomal protein L24